MNKEIAEAEMLRIWYFQSLLWNIQVFSEMHLLSVIICLFLKTKKTCNCEKIITAELM